MSRLAGVFVRAPSERAETKARRRHAFEVTELEVRLPQLNEVHDGLRIVQLSDLHIGSGMPEGRITAAVDAVNALKPDLVVMTGDYITRRWDPVARVPELLGRLSIECVAVLGNHDHWTHPTQLQQGLERIGVRVLRNQHTTLRLRGADFSVIGLDDARTHHDDAEKAFAGKPRGSQMVITHTPKGATTLPADQGLWCVAGHTHGGQLEIPALTATVFRTIRQPWYRGSYDVRGNHLYVNRGLGFGRGTPWPRLNSDPEVSLFTLRAA